MSEKVKKGLPVVLFVLGLGLLVAAALGDSLPGWTVGLLGGLGGATVGVGGSTIFMGAACRLLSPEERVQVEMAEHDERNLAIREKAAQDSWYWTSALLWIPFVVALVRTDPLFIALASGVIVLHNVFYLVNMGRWSRKL